MSLLDRYATGGDRSFLLPTESFTVETFNTLLLWLGVEGCEYTTVLRANNDNTYDEANIEPERALSGNCRYNWL